MPEQQTGGHKYIILKDFRTINTSVSREALKEDECAWLENIMPIGKSNVVVVPGASSSIATLPQTISTQHPANIGSSDYIISFTNDGAAYAVNISNTSTATLCAAGTFTGTTMDLDQWKSERIVMADSSNGFFSWDGQAFYQPGSVATVTIYAGGTGFTSVPTVVFTGGGGTGVTGTATLSSGAVSSIKLINAGTGFTAAPVVSVTGGGGIQFTATAYLMPTGLNGTSTAVYSGRVWVANGRQITFTSPNSWFDLTIASAAGSQFITEGFLRKSITALFALENYLYIFGDQAVYILGDLAVASGITSYSLTNLSSNIGTSFPFTIASYERAVIFANASGVYALYGATITKISKPLDGIWQHVDFTVPLSSGVGTIYNILCYVLSFRYTVGTPRQLQAVFFDGKWFLTSQGDGVTYIVSVPDPSDYGIDIIGTTGTNTIKFYHDTTGNVASTLKTALLPLGNPIFDKQMNRVGFEYTGSGSTQINVQLDNENGGNLVTFNNTNLATWLNSSNNTVTWQNSLLQSVGWVASGFNDPNAYCDVVGKYLGFTLTSNSPGIILHGALGEYSIQAPWS